MEFIRSFRFRLKRRMCWFYYVCIFFFFPHPHITFLPVILLRFFSVTPFLKTFFVWLVHLRGYLLISVVVFLINGKTGKKKRRKTRKMYGNYGFIMFGFSYLPILTRLNIIVKTCNFRININISPFEG